MKWWLGAVILLVAGMALQLGLLVYAMYVLLGVLVISRFLTAQWIDHLSATRECSGRVLEIGDKVNATVTIENHGRFTLPCLLLEDAVPEEFEPPPRLRFKGPRMAVTRLAAHGEKEIKYEAECQTRGYFQFGPLLAETGDLFGLHRRYRVMTEPHFVTVLPKIVPLEGYDLASRRPVGEVRITHRLFEDPTRTAGARLYQNGDSIHRIHWRATARTGQLHSKNFEPSCMAGVTLLLDFHEANYPGRGRRYRSELAVTTAASLANTLAKLRQPLGLVTNGRDAADRIREEGWDRRFRSRAAARATSGMKQSSDRLRPIQIETKQGPAQLPMILETLARVELTDGLSFPQLIAEVSGTLPRHATVVALLADVPMETAFALGQLRRQGYAVVAVVAMFDENKFPDWARRPDWAAWLLAEHIEVRRVDDEESIGQLCSAYLMGR